MSLIADAPHTSSVYALRDSEILMLPRAAFRELVQSDARVLEQLTRTILRRLRQESRPSPRSDPKVFALISTSPSIDLRMRADTIRKSAAAIGAKTIVLGEEAADRTAEYFDAVERENDLILLISPLGDTPWYKQCMRQADRVVIFARGDARPSFPLLRDDPSPALRFRLVDLVLLHHGADRHGATTADWLDAAGATRVFHWHGDDAGDCRRIARVFAGRSIGLVLSGGGARAYAHLGVVKALREAGCPLDFVGGASMGAVVAACVAMGWDDAEIDARIRDGFVKSDPLNDYRLPVVSLTAGKRVDERLEKHFGGVRIEDMKRPFFAVSTNLSVGSVRIDRRGPLREALRASISLPGILPPVVRDGEVYVDGAVLNNFPVDVMREAHRGVVIGVDVARQGALDAADFVNPPGFSAWVAKHGFSAPPPIASLLMRAATVTTDPNEHRANVDVLILPEIQGVELRDWKAFDSAVEAGYAAAEHAVLNARGRFAAILQGKA